MSAQTHQPPHLREVFNRSDVEDVARQLQKNRMGAFLSAKDLLITAAQTGRNVTRSAIERLHLGAAVTLAQRACGWLVGSMSRARRGIMATGVRPGLLWLLSTGIGQTVLLRAAQGAGHVLWAVGRTTLSAATWTLRRFGTWGAKQAAKLENSATSFAEGLGRQSSSAATMGKQVLAPSGLVMETVRTIARGKLLHLAATRFLPHPWRRLAYVAANVLALPARVRSESLRLLWTVGQAAAATRTPEPRPAVPEPTPPTTPSPMGGACPVPPSTDRMAEQVRPVAVEFLAPADVPADAKPAVIETAVQLTLVPEDSVLIDLDGQRSLRTPEPAVGSLQRYPAKRTASGKRKR